MRRKHMINGRIVFRTNKGKEHLSVRIHPRLQAIVNQYTGKFLFPYITALPDDAEKHLQLIAAKNAIVNRDLKILAQLCDSNIPLSFHHARHTFTQHIKMTGSNVQVIKDELGHRDSKIKEVYLKALDSEILDKEMEKLYGR